MHRRNLSTQKSNRSGQNSGEFLIFLFFFSGYQSSMPKHRILQVSQKRFDANQLFIPASGAAKRRKNNEVVLFLGQSHFGIV
jgi:hypothetical protein